METTTDGAFCPKLKKRCWRLLQCGLLRRFIVGARSAAMPIAGNEFGYFVRSVGFVMSWRPPPKRKLIRIFEIPDKRSLIALS